MKVFDKLIVVYWLFIIKKWLKNQKFMNKATLSVAFDFGLKACFKIVYQTLI